MFNRFKKSLSALIKGTLSDNKDYKADPSSYNKLESKEIDVSKVNPSPNPNEYLQNLEHESIRALTELTIFEDIDLKIKSLRTISKGDIFKIEEIKTNNFGLPTLKLVHGYVTAKKSDIEPTNDLPLISLIIPIYNVEKYLEACLLSLQKQTYTNIEVIMINDGSPDNSINIAEHFKQNDQRFILYTKPNGGLSAARNTGIELAKGQYIWFIDSDDVISERAVELMINSLQSNGADFVVGCYRRLNAIGPKKAGYWINNAHSKSQYNLNIKDFPNILVNATAWSKVVNYQFLLKNNLYFPVGVLYEDQLWSTKLYSSAHSFNIVKDVIYDWRIRDDQSSITQQAKSSSNIEAVFKAFISAIDEYKSRGLEDIAHARTVQILSFSMKGYMSNILHTDSEYAQILANGLKELCKDLPLSKWAEVPAQFSALEWLLIHHEFERAHHYLKEDAINLNKLAATFKNGKLLLKVPYWNDLEVDFPEEILEVPPQHYQPNLHLTQAKWENLDTLTLEGWAYLPLADPNDITPSLKLILVAENHDHEIDLSVYKIKYHDPSQMSKHLINDYSEFGFKTKIPCSDLKLVSKINYNLKFIISINSHEFTGTLNHVLKGSPVIQSKPHTTSDARCVRIIAKSKRPVVINLQKKNVLLNDFDISNEILSIDLKSQLNLKALEIKSIDEQQNVIDKYIFSIEKNERGNYLSKINLAEINLSKKTDWLVRVIDQKNKAHPIDGNNLLNESNTLIKEVNQHKLLLINSDFGNLALLHQLDENLSSV